MLFFEKLKLLSFRLCNMTFGKKKHQNYRPTNGNSENANNKHNIKKLLQYIIALSKKKDIYVSTKVERSFETRRKLFHLIGLIFPIATIHFDKNILLCLSASFTAILVVADYKNWASFLKKIPRGNALISLFREHELIHGQLCGMSWLFIGYTIILCSCEKYLVAMSMAILIVCDAVAAIIGKNFGKHKICGAKTFEGSMAFFFSGLFVIMLFLNNIIPATMFFNVYFLILALIFSAIVELVAKNVMIDDNFAIPITFCFTYKTLMTIFYAGLW